MNIWGNDMRVTIEAQILTEKNFRGIPYYTANLIEQLVRLNDYDYGISFFDYNGERGNRELIQSHIAPDVYARLRVSECNSESYLSVMNWSAGAFDEVNMHTYADFVDVMPDVLHLPHSINIGYELPKHTVVTVNDIMPIIYKGLGYWSENAEARFFSSQRYLQRRKDVQLIAISQSTKNDLCSYLDIEEDRIHVVYDAYDDKNCYPDKNPEVLNKYNITGPYIMYIGALDARKGLLNIVEAFGQIEQKYPDVKLVLAGGLDGQFGERMKKIQEVKYADKIIFTGYVNDDEKRALLSSAEIFLFPSEYEGFGIPVLEAMACACPVITTNVSSLPEVGGDAALYVEPNNSEQLAAEIEGLLASSQKREMYSRKSLERCKVFSWEKTARETQKVYEKVMGI
jgi:glycosyltransferase involved in cell wall biosynthesis